MKKEIFGYKEIYIGIIEKNNFNIEHVKVEVHNNFIRSIQEKSKTYFFYSEKSANALFYDGKIYYFHDNLDDLKNILKDTIKSEIGELTMDNNYKKLSIKKNEKRISNLTKIYNKI